MTQQTSCSGQLQRYDEELRHLIQELAGIKMVPGRTYDLRNRAVPRIVSNLSASASQSTWAHALPQPQNNLSSAGRITWQERVKTPVNTTQRMGDVEQAGGVHWSVSQNGRRSSGTIRVAGRRCGILTVDLVQGDQPRTEGKYSRFCIIFWTRAVMRKWNERTTQLAVIIAENIWRLLPDTRRRRGRVTQLELDGIQRTHGPTKGNAYSHSCMSSLPSLMVRATSSPILCS